jgi:hypothetical protein
MGKKSAHRPEAVSPSSRPGRNPVAQAQARLKTFADGSPQTWQDF